MKLRLFFATTAAIQMRLIMAKKARIGYSFPLTDYHRKLNAFDLTLNKTPYDNIKECATRIFHIHMAIAMEGVNRSVDICY